MALPGIALDQAGVPVLVPDAAGSASAAAGEDAGTGGSVGLRWLHYRDWQPGLRRIAVGAPALTVRLPLGERWVIEGVTGYESVTGASPRYHTAVSGASRMVERRRSGDVRVTRYASLSHWSLAAAVSSESDFHSRAVSARFGWDTEDRNRSWALELAARSDRIGSVNDPNLQARRHTREAGVTVTQALSRTDIVQAGLVHAWGRGFYSDPYKLPDTRPGSRHQTVVTLRWNHHFDEPDLALRARYRHYRDSFGIRSHTVAIEPVWQVAPRISIGPSVRLYTQSAASFYYNPRFAYTGVPFPPDNPPPVHISADQRLAAFGAVTLGLQLAVELGGGWQAELGLDRYEQRTAWHWGSPGSRGLAPLSARFVQFGVTRRF